MILTAMKFNGHSKLLKLLDNGSSCLSALMSMCGQRDLVRPQHLSPVRHAPRMLECNDFLSETRQIANSRDFWYTVASHACAGPQVRERDCKDLLGSAEWARVMNFAAVISYSQQDYAVEP